MENKEIIKSHLDLHSKTLAFTVPVLFSLFYAYIKGDSEVEILGQKWSKEIFGYLFIGLSPIFYINLLRGLHGINVVLDEKTEGEKMLNELRTNTALFNPYYSYGTKESGLLGMANKLIMLATMFTSIIIMVIFLRESSASQFKNLSLFSGFITGKVHYNTVKTMLSIDKKLFSLKQEFIPNSIWPIILAVIFAVFIYLRH